jgi:hypothetical protein
MLRFAFLILLMAATPARAQPDGALPAASGGATESVHEALCRMIESSARSQGLPVGFFTRLIWRESSFRTRAVSPKGAQGVAQFMPGTAAERGLADPFDPEQAIPKAAHLLADLRRQFGNLGLAAAAYNGGPGRVQSWLDGRGGLPAETRSYVYLVTRRSADDWAVQAGRVPADTADAPKSEQRAPEEDRQSCIQLTVAFRRGGERYEPGPGLVAAGPPIAPWGVQLAGNFSKDRALASFGRARASLARVIGDAQPMIIGTRLRSRGTRAFYRVRVPSETRAAADALCNRIRSAGGACIVLRS